MKIYISGKIANGKTLSPEEFKEVMEKFEIREKQIIKAGHTPINPLKAVMYEPDKQWSDYMLDDIAILLKEADAITMLEDWVDSKGARIERHIATVTDMIFFRFYDDHYETSDGIISEYPQETSDKNITVDSSDIVLVTI